MATINWREWGNEPFDEAKRTGKLILLDISAVWCHWCHVMDETTYNDARVAAVINEQFIPVRVDNDRNPEINARYNMGGWPTTAFLNPERDVVSGTTYLPPDQMIVLLERLADLNHRKNGMLAGKTGIARVQIEPELNVNVSRSASSDDVIEVLDAVESSYDRKYSGFGLGQKFPFTSVLRLLLLDYELTGNERHLVMATDTLRAMIAGEIFDKVQGGMFRYSTKRDWSDPHYEKMLDDNARIAWVLLEAYRIDGSEDFLDAVKGIFSYVENVLMNPETGLAYGSQDADERYYRQDADGRRMMPPPEADTAAYTDSNSALAHAYIKLWSITGDNSARDKAVEIVSFLNAVAKSPDNTVCHYYENGKALHCGSLADHVCLLSANIACFEATGDISFLDIAQQLTTLMIEIFRAENGAFYDISADLAKEQGISRGEIPISENARAAESIIALSDLAGDKYLELAGEVMDVLSQLFTNYGIIAADYAISVALMNASRPIITVNAVPGTTEADGFIKTAMAACGPICAVKTISLNGDHTPSAAVCTPHLCRARVTEPEELADQLIKLISDIRQSQECS